MRPERLPAFAAASLATFAVARGVEFQHSHGLVELRDYREHLTYQGPRRIISRAREVGAVGREYTSADARELPNDHFGDYQIAGETIRARLGQLERRSRRADRVVLPHLDGR